MTRRLDRRPAVVTSASVSFNEDEVIEISPHCYMMRRHSQLASYASEDADAKPPVFSTYRIRRKRGLKL
jgi:hypothetical protein